MPELPEVETTLRGISPHIHGQTVANTIIRQPKLRWRIRQALTGSSKALQGRVTCGTSFYDWD